MWSPIKKTSLKDISTAIKMADGGSLKEVSCVCVRAGDAILFGQRNDNLLWSLPGGHRDNNESPHQAGVRELFEETGIKAHKDALTYLGHKLTNNGYMVHAFLLDVSAKPDMIETMTTRHDPDNEFSQLKWVHRGTQEWDQVMNNAHCPRS